MNIFEKIRTGSLEDVVKALEDNPALFFSESDKSLGIFSYSLVLEKEKIFDYLLNTLSSSDINKSGIYHPLSLSIQFNDTVSIKKLLESGKIIKSDYNSFLIDAFDANAPKETFTALKKWGASWNDTLFSTTVFNRVLENTKSEKIFSLLNDEEIKECINRETFSIINRNLNFSEKAIQEVFKHHRTLTEEDKDIYFNNCYENKNYYLLNEILKMPGFYPGWDAINHLIEIAIVYTPSEDSEYKSIVFKEREIAAVKEISEYIIKLEILSPNIAQDKGSDVLSLSAKHDKKELFDSFLKSGADIDYINDDGNTPLINTIRMKKSYYSEALVNAGAKSNIQNNNGDTALMVAVKSYNLEGLELINSSYGGFKNHTNNKGYNALNLAILSRDTKMISSLLWSNIDILSNPLKVENDSRVIALTSDSSIDNCDLVRDITIFNTFKSLKTLGLNVNQVNEDGDTFAHHFIKKVHTNNLKALLSLNINPNELDKNQNTLLMSASKIKSDEIFNLILNVNSYGAKYTHCNAEGKSVYDILIKGNNPERLPYVLLKHLEQKPDQETFKKILNRVLPHIASSGDLTPLNPQVFNWLKENNNQFPTNQSTNTLIVNSLMFSTPDNFNILVKNITEDIVDPSKDNQLFLNFISLLKEQNPERYLKIQESLSETLTASTYNDIFDKNNTLILNMGNIKNNDNANTSKHGIR